MSMFSKSTTQGNIYSMFSSKLNTSAMPEALMMSKDNFEIAHKNAAAVQGIGPSFDRQAKEAVAQVVSVLMEKVVPVSSKGFSAA